jgi:hypothetical protein
VNVGSTWFRCGATDIDLPWSLNPVLILKLPAPISCALVAGRLRLPPRPHIKHSIDLDDVNRGNAVPNGPPPSAEDLATGEGPGAALGAALTGLLGLAAATGFMLIKC